MKRFEARVFGNVFVWEDGKRRVLPPRLDLIDFKARGFAWGGRNYDKCHDTTQPDDASTAGKSQDIKNINAPPSTRGRTEDASIAGANSTTSWAASGIENGANSAERNAGAPSSGNADLKSKDSLAENVRSADTAKTPRPSISTIKMEGGKRPPAQSGIPNSSITRNDLNCSAPTVISTTITPDHDGRSQLALAILADVYDDETALQYYQGFKRDVIATCQRDLPFDLEVNRVLKVIEQMKMEVPCAER